MITEQELQSIDALAARQAQPELITRHIQEYRRIFSIIKGGMIIEREAMKKQLQQVHNGPN